MSGRALSPIYSVLAIYNDFVNSEECELIFIKEVARVSINNS